VTAGATPPASPIPPLRITIEDAAGPSAAFLEPWVQSARSEIYGRASDPAGVERLTAAGQWPEQAHAHQHRLIKLHSLPIGLVTYELDGGRLLIHELAIARDHRDRGFGAEAVYTIEMLSKASESIAFVPVTNGLAVYFWLRIGYRPRFRSQTGQTAYTLMVRDLRAVSCAGR
jgi:hypothetical protein